MSALTHHSANHRLMAGLREEVLVAVSDMAARTGSPKLHLGQAPNTPLRKFDGIPSTFL
jgi:hypothetical protein